MYNNRYKTKKNYYFYLFIYMKPYPAHAQGKNDMKRPQIIGNKCAHKNEAHNKVIPMVLIKKIQKNTVNYTSQAIDLVKSTTTRNYFDCKVATFQTRCMNGCD